MMNANGASPHRLDQLVDAEERIGVIGSPSSTHELALDILGAAVGRKLIGELALFRYLQDGAGHHALGQITEVSLRNSWHEDPTMRSLIRQRGRVDAVSERQDTHLGELTVSAVFARDPQGRYTPSILGTVPPTGTDIHLVNDAILDELLAPYRDHLFYLGKVYGSTPRLPLWFKHFGRGSDGAGEAYHLGIFGKTGSGKSVLAKMVLTAYARYPQMALLVIDPQGEFAKEARGGRAGEFALPVRDILRGLNKKPVVLGVRNLVLDTWALFEQILFESPFFEQLSIPRGDNRQLASSVLADKLKKKSIKLADLHTREAFSAAWALLKEDKVQKIFYRTDSSRGRFNSVLEEAEPDEFYTSYWQPLTELFRQDRAGAKTVERALNYLFDSVHQDRPLLIVNLSKEEAQGLLWNDKIQSLVIKRLLSGVAGTAERAFGEDRNLNTLVVMDEAHRLAPRHLPDDDAEARGVRDTLIDAVRTTRKYGLGWMFISQSLASLHPEILNQLRISFFGFGLALGSEFQSLSQLLGGKSHALDLYRLFRDPHSAFDVASRQYSFMTIGPVSPLSFAGTPLFLNVFNSVPDFSRANGFDRFSA